MKRIIVSISLLLSIASVGAMTQGPVNIGSSAIGQQNEFALANALVKGNAAEVEAILARPGVSAIARFKLLHYAGLSPIQVVFNFDVLDKLAKAELLVAKGATPADLNLNELLLKAVAKVKPDEVRWLIAKGAKDIGGKALAQANALEEGAFSADEKARLAKIKTLLTLKEPLAVRKPAPAKPKQ